MSELRDKYCIVGIGETAYTRRSTRSTRSLAVDAVKNALTDAGLHAGDIDGLLSYQYNDSASPVEVAHDLGIRPEFSLDTIGGGASTEALVGLACAVIEAGLCKTVAIFRSMNGYSGARMSGTPTLDGVAATVVTGSDLRTIPYGLVSAAQHFQFTFARHMYEFGTTCEQLAHVKVIQSRHASNNPKALYQNRVTVDDVLSSRWIAKPACHLLDCCVETDGASCIIVSSAERARNLKSIPVYILAAAGRVNSPFPADHHQYTPITRTAGTDAAKGVFSRAGVGPTDVQLTATYDCFTFPPVLQFEAYGFCDVGEGGAYVTSGSIELSGNRPNNTGGGQLCEGYTNGMNSVIELVRQLRHQADDFCPGWESGDHSYDYGEGKCRQVKLAEVAMSTGWGGPSLASALIMRR